MRKRNKVSNQLAGQVSLVTGSSQGIGAGIARKFAEHGASIMLHGLERKQAEKTAAALRKSGFRVDLLCGDLKDELFCRSLVQETVRRLGRIDILVNNAAVTHRGNIENTSVDLWDQILDTNIRAPFILCQEVVKFMKGRRSRLASRKCIINIGSVNAYTGQTKLLAYSASKGAMMTFTKNLAGYLTRYRIRVNQINPGWVLTEGERHVEAFAEGKGPGWLKEALKTRPFGRMLYPADIAQAALFLATNDLLTGAVLDYEQLPIGTLPELL